MGTPPILARLKSKLVPRILIILKGHGYIIEIILHGWIIVVAASQ
jgi:hypothetical protein